MDNSYKMNELESNDGEVDKDDLKNDDERMVTECVKSTEIWGRDGG